LDKEAEIERLRTTIYKLTRARRKRLDEEQESRRRFSGAVEMILLLDRIKVTEKRLVC
jgi:hypothetical protein